MILAISGSTRRLSSNLGLINAIAELFKNTIHIKIFNQISKIDHFNPDLDNEYLPEKVSEFRKELLATDGILICTPEYAMGVPGTLKNAIDWTVSSTVFAQKPVALITASTAGQKGHQSLLDTLRVIEADIPDSSQLIVSHIRAKLEKNRITDPQLESKVIDVIESLINSIERKINREKLYRDT